MTRQHQASEREGSPEKMLSTAEEVFVPRTRHKKQSGRRDQGGSERRNTDELKRVAQLERVRKSNWLKRKSKVGESKFSAFLTLTPKNDSCLISPYNIPLESHIKVMRIKVMITK